MEAQALYSDHHTVRAQMHLYNLAERDALVT